MNEEALFNSNQLMASQGDSRSSKGGRKGGKKGGRLPNGDQYMMSMMQNDQLASKKDLDG